MMLGRCWSIVYYVGPESNQGLLLVLGSADILENTSPCPDAESMLGQRRRRWPNIDSALGQGLLFAEIAQPCVLSDRDPGGCVRTSGWGVKGGWIGIRGAGCGHRDGTSIWGVKGKQK